MGKVVEAEPPAVAPFHWAAPEPVRRAAVAREDPPLDEVAFLHLATVQAEDLGRDRRRPERVRVAVGWIVRHGGSPDQCAPGLTASTRVTTRSSEAGTGAGATMAAAGSSTSPQNRYSIAKPNIGARPEMTNGIVYDPVRATISPMATCQKNEVTHQHAPSTPVTLP